jgi:NAD(P)-dependent dehydrogenase (short-subunit alcohol dehydrogenase family)
VRWRRECSTRQRAYLRLTASRTPLKKVATPLEIANQILVLASPTVSSHVTGQVVMVEGGMEGRLLNTREEVGL